MKYLVRRWFKHWYTWFNILGVIVSIWLSAGNLLVPALLILLSLLIAAIIYSYNCSMESSKLKEDFKNANDRIIKIKEQFEKFHEIVHGARNALNSALLREAEADDLKKTEIFARIVYNVLDQVSSIFTDLCGAACTASIMLPWSKDPNLLATTFRSTNTLSKRKESEPTKLPIGHGMAGACFNDGKVRYSNDFQNSATKGDFQGVRKEWFNFYLSGISSPFKVNGKIAGVFNLDCAAKNAFDDFEKIKYLVQVGGDAVALAIQVDDFLKKPSSAEEPALK